MSEVLFNTLDLTLLITVYQCISFALFLLFIKKGNKQSNILLALFLLSQAAIPLDTLINFGEAFRQYAINFSPNIFYVFGTAYWLEAVLLLFYVRSLIYKNFHFTKIHILYFLPFILYVFFEINDWYLLDYETKQAILNGYVLAEEPAYTRFMNLFRELFRVYASIICLIELKRYQAHIMDTFADIEAVDLSWLKILVIGFLIIHVQAVIVTLGYISVIELNTSINFQLIGQISNIMVMFLITFLMFFSLGFTSMFKGLDINKHSINNQSQSKEEIDPQQINTITQYMNESKPYLNHLLNLDNLANQLFMPSRQLSQIINRHFEQNFFEFINGYRIDEAKILLTKANHQKTTMLDIMDLSGFNSKATFNTFFKKLVGLTPTQYRKEQLENQ